MKRNLTNWKEKLWEKGRVQRYLSLFLVAVLVTTQCTQSMGVSLVTAQTSCTEHQEHTEDCGYVKAVVGVECDHKCGDDCKTQQLNCKHEHNTDCGYLPAVPGEPCQHQCGDGMCNAVAAVEEQPCMFAHSEEVCECNGEETKENCTHICEESVCGYREAVEAVTCDHKCEGSNCGYTEGTPEIPCNHVCGEECYEIVEECQHVHDTECGYVEAVEGADCQHTCVVCNPSGELSLTEAIFDKNTESENYKDIEITFEKGADNLISIEREIEAAEEDTGQTETEGEKADEENNNREIVAYDLSETEDEQTVTLHKEVLEQFEDGEYDLYFMMESEEEKTFTLTITTSEQLEKAEEVASTPMMLAEAEEEIEEEPEELGDVPIEEAYFPDEEFRKLLSGSRYDQDGDGVLSREERIAVTEISDEKTGHTSKTIKDLTGIEYFPEITSIMMRFGALESVDLSKNEKITYINLRNNDLKELKFAECYKDQLTYLNVGYNPDYRGTDGAGTLDLSGFGKLRSLYAYYNPSLTNITVGGCEELKTLSLEQCGVKELNISGCTDLTTLYAQYNELKSLDLSSCSSLVTLKCDYNHLSSLDLSNQTAVLKTFTGEGQTLSRIVMTESAEAGYVDSTNTEFVPLYTTFYSDNTWAETSELKNLEVNETTKHLTTTTLESSTDPVYFQTNLPVPAGVTTKCVLKGSFYYTMPGELVAETCYMDLNTAKELGDDDDTLAQYFDISLDGETVDSGACTVTCDDGDYEAIREGTIGTYEITIQYAPSGETYSTQATLEVGLEIGNTTNFPSSHFRTYLRRYCDSEKDGFLTNAELISKEVMTVNGAGEIIAYSSLKGIEYFTEVKTLKFPSAVLESLDLSKNTKLEVLDISNNRLQELNITGCDLLQEIHCEGNQLTSLNVSHLSGLQTFSGGEQSVPNLTMLQNGTKWMDTTNTQFMPGVTKFYSDSGMSSETELKNLTVDTDSKRLTAEELPSAADPIYFQSVLPTAQDVTAECILSGSFYCNAVDNMTAETCYMDVNTAGSMEVENDLAKYFDVFFNGIDVGYELDLTVECEDTDFAAIQEGQIGTYSVVLSNGTLSTNATLVVCVEINNVDNFPDEAFQEFVSRYDTDKDGFLIKTELESVKQIVKDSTAIKNLKGIEYFSNLNKIQMRFGALESVDVSKNANLTYLNIRNNKLKELNISGCDDLEYLHVGFNKNFLGTDGEGTLDVSGFEYLETLYAQNCISLKKINASGCISLDYLNCSNKNYPSNNYPSSCLEDIELSDCGKLTSLYVGYHSLKSLDLSDCGDLQYLECDGNQISSLNLSGLSKLKTFNGKYQKLSKLILFPNENNWTDCTETEFTPNVTSFYSDSDRSSETELTTLTVDAGSKRLTAEAPIPHAESIYFQSSLPTEQTVTADCTLSGSFSYAVLGKTCYMDVNTAGNLQTKDELAKYFDLNYDGLSETYDFNLTVECEDTAFDAIQNKIVGTYPLTISYGASVMSANLIVCVEIDNVDNFPDEAFQEFVSRYDTDKDGFLIKTELEKVKIFDKDNTAIKNLKGIEYFSELTFIQMRFGALESVDLSKNEKIIYINLRNNDLKELKFAECYKEQLTYLNVGYNPDYRGTDGAGTLDLSGFVELGTLYAYYSPSLTKINVSGCGKLETLDLRESGVEELNISGCIGLTALYAQYNELKSLDLSGCSSLATLKCDYNHLSSLVLSNQTAALKTFSGEGQTLSRMVMTEKDGGGYYDSKKTQFIPSYTTFYSDDTWAETSKLQNLEVNETTKYLTATTLESSTDPVYFQTNLPVPAGVTIKCELKGSFYYAMPGELVAETCYMDLNTAKELGDDDDALAQYFDISLDGEMVDSGACVVTCGAGDYEAIREGTIGTYKITIQYTVSDKTYETQANLEVGTEINNTTNFPSSHFRTYLRICDSEKDGFLTNAELTGKTSISLNYSSTIYNYTSLKGIEYFKELESLSCPSAVLESLDVSKNTKLTYLNISDNRLKELNITGCNSLKELYCENNQLSGSLDVSGFTALEKLNCSNNQLTELNVINCTALSELKCDTNHLSNVDITGCSSLTSFTGTGQTLSDLHMEYKEGQWIDDITKTEFVPNVTTFYSDSGMSSEAELKSLVVDTATNYLTAKSIAPSTDPVYFKSDIVFADTSVGELSGSFYYVVEGELEAEICYMDVNSTESIENKNQLAKYFDITFNGTPVSDEISFTVECDDEHFDAIQDGMIDTYPLTIKYGTAQVDAVLVVCVQIDNEENFFDSSFRSFVAGYDTGDDKEGFLTRQELEAVEEMNLRDDSVEYSDLTGIAYFENLLTLDCGGNNIEELNVSDNMRLQTLNCEANGMKTLTIGNNENLLTLNVSSNELSELEISGCENLVTLKCTDNQLDELNLTGNESIEILWCSMNNLEELSLDSNGELLELFCDSNKLTELEVTYLSQLNSLSCEGNFLTNLDISELENLNSVKAYEQKNIGTLPLVYEENRWINKKMIDTDLLRTFSTDGTSFSTSEGDSLNFEIDTGILTAENVLPIQDEVYFVSDLVDGNLNRWTGVLTGSFNYDPRYSFGANDAIYHSEEIKAVLNEEADLKKLPGLLTINPNTDEFLAEVMTSLESGSSFDNLKNGVEGKYTYQAELLNQTQSGRRIQVVSADAVINTDRTAYILAQSFYIGLSSVKDFDTETVIEKSASFYKTIDDVTDEDSSSFSVSAEQIQNVVNGKADNSYDITITHKESNLQITIQVTVLNDAPSDLVCIPATIVMKKRNGEDQATAESYVKLYNNVEQIINGSVEIYADSSIYLYASENAAEKLLVEVYDSENEKYDGKNPLVTLDTITPENNFKLISGDTNQLKSRDYSGTMQFRIEYVKEEENQ